MSKIIYYIGAGASYGVRDPMTREIIEGVPVVNEIPAEFEAFKAFIEKAEIPEEDISFQDLYLTSHDEVENEKRRMLGDIEMLIRGIKEHATIDTYARKLFLTKQNRNLERLKALLCSFLLWEQLEHRIDGRYDTFLANIINSQTLNIPKDISFISWNYNSQFELAFSAYGLDTGLAVFEKNMVGNWPILTDCGRILKVNGSATFADMEMVSMIRDYDETPKAIQIIQSYANAMADTSSLGFQFKTHLSFAWEKSANDENMKSSIENTIADAEIVVVIGYSFPFFNRETDRQIFRGMTNLSKVYVQDINPNAVVQSIKAVLPEKRKVEVFPISSCEQFYLPPEL